MKSRCLLDSSVVIAALRGEPGVRERIAQVEEVFLSSIVAGELYFGARQSHRMAENLANTEAFASGCTVLGTGLETGRVYGVLKRQLETRGRRIPENDLWIAASALEHGLSLVTRDLHFREIEGLAINVW